MIRVLWLVALTLGCDGGSDVGSLRQACTKVCSCFNETSSGADFSGSFSQGSSCVDDCVAEGATGSPTSSGGNGGVSQECTSCILDETCDNLVQGSACEAECDF